MAREAEQRWNLTGVGQDTYAGQNAQNPNTSRRVQSFLPQDDGQMHRELGEPLYASNDLPGPVAGLYEFDQNNGQGGVVRYYFCAARVNSTVGTQQCLFYSLVSGAWAQVTAVGTLANAPMCVTQENNFFLADGVSNWLFDGTIWVAQGLQIPLNQPAMLATTGNAQVLFGTDSVLNGVAGGGVALYLYKANFYNSAFAGAVSIQNGVVTAAGADATVTRTVLQSPSLLFNYAEGDITNELKWAQLSTTGVYTGETTPFATATTGYDMDVITSLVIPVAGNYTITFSHDDGAYFGFGTGDLTGAAPAFVSGTPYNQNTTFKVTPLNGYPILSGSNGTASGAEWFDSVVVNFPAADTYPLEIAYTNWETNQQLIFQIQISSSFGASGANVPIPNPFAGSGSNPGLITAALGRYYWFDNADQTVGVATESSSSPIGVSTGPLIGGSVKVYQQPGKFTSSTATKVVTGAAATDGSLPIGPDLNGTMAGDVIYINGTLIGTIASVGGGSSIVLTGVSGPSLITLANNTVISETTYFFKYAPAQDVTFVNPGANNALAGQLFTITGFVNSGNNVTAVLVLKSAANQFTIQNALSVAETHAGLATTPGTTLQLVANSLATVVGGKAVICDSRCTHWNVYASESDGSKIGQYLFSVPVTQNLASTPYIDTSPFLDNPANTFLPIFRPVRNDPPVASKLLYVHKVRQFRRQESAPNFFAFTANEEVTAGNNGDPAQCLPGANVNTVSDMVNVVSFPDQSARLRGLISHMDALYMFSEKACYPLYGQSVDDFAISQMVAFALGLAGRFAAKSTPNGLCFMSYDKRAFLYPTSLYSTYLAQGGAGQSALTEIGKPMRNVFAQIPSSRLDEVVSEYYHYGIRDWWVICFPTSVSQDLPQTWVWDFNQKCWFQLQRGFASVAMLEVSEGALVLIGGGVDGNTYVVDDQTGSFANTVALPVATWQPALIDFGNSEVAHVFRRLELEFSSRALATDCTVTIWLDPLSVDSPGVGRTATLKPALGAGRYSAFLTDGKGGALCQRMLLQVQARASTNSGVIRGAKLYADPAPGFITGSNSAGGV